LNAVGWLALPPPSVAANDIDGDDDEEEEFERGRKRKQPRIQLSSRQMKEIAAAVAKETSSASVNHSTNLMISGEHFTRNVM